MIEIKAGQICQMLSGVVMVVSEPSEHAWTSKVVYLVADEDAGYKPGDITYYDDEELQNQIEVVIASKGEPDAEKMAADLAMLKANAEAEPEHSLKIGDRVIFNGNRKEGTVTRVKGRHDVRVLYDDDTETWTGSYNLKMLES